MEGVAYRQFLELERDHWWFIGRRRSYFRILERFLPPQRLAAVADVGCGVGGMLPELGARYGDAIGLDADPESIKICRERGFERSFVAGAHELPFASESHDLLTYFDCIEHIEDDRAALTEILRVLKPGATAFFSVPAYQFLYSNNDKVAHHFRRYTKGELTGKARDAGLEVVWSTYVNVVLFPVILPAVLLLKAKERLFPKAGDTRTNLSRKPSKLTNPILAGIFGGEGHVLKRVPAPFGHSLVMVARKPRAAAS